MRSGASLEQVFELTLSTLAAPPVNGGGLSHWNTFAGIGSISFGRGSNLLGNVRQLRRKERS